MTDHPAERLAVRLWQLIETTDPRPIDLAGQPRRCIFGPFPIVLAQRLFWYFLDAAGVSFRQAGLHFQGRVDGAVGR